jgi:hypothetical protein
MAIFHTSAPKRKARKPNAKQRELAAEWQAMLKKYEPKKAVALPTKSLSDVYSLKTPVGRETPRFPSRDTGYHNTALKPSPQYTGDKMLGIGTLHKSNAVPVFCDNEAKEMARMRRG